MSPSVVRSHSSIETSPLSSERRGKSSCECNKSLVLRVVGIIAVILAAICVMVGIFSVPPIQGWCLGWIGAAGALTLIAILSVAFSLNYCKSKQELAESQKGVVLTSSLAAEAQKGIPPAPDLWATISREFIAAAVSRADRIAKVFATHEPEGMESRQRSSSSDPTISGFSEELSIAAGLRTTKEGDVLKIIGTEAGKRSSPVPDPVLTEMRLKLKPVRLKQTESSEEASSIASIATGEFVVQRATRVEIMGEDSE